MNFANKFQTLFGLAVTASQFLQNENTSLTAFSSAAAENNRPDLSLAFETERVNETPERFDLLVESFLRAIWAQGQTPEEALEGINPSLWRLIGKAADAIEGRLGLRWPIGDSTQLLRELEVV